MKIGIHRSGPARLALRKPTYLPGHMAGKIVELWDLWCNASSRRAGHASKLLAETCLQADLEGVFLILAVKSAAEMDEEALTAFYAKHNFGIIQMEPMRLMVRPPVRERIAIARATAH